MRQPSSAAAIAAALLLGACASTGSTMGAARAEVAADTAGAAAAVQAWWRAFVLADTAFLERHTAPRLSFTLSSGRTFDRAAMMASLSSHTLGAAVVTEWTGVPAVHGLPGGAAVAARFREGTAGAAGTFRCLTVLERRGPGADDWWVVAAQSTRDAELTPRVQAAAAGPLADFAGTYRGQRGGALRVVVRDTALVLVEPSGAESRMEPIGPALFERTVISPGAGLVRFAFLRDTSGAVVAMQRLAASAVNTWERER